MGLLVLAVHDVELQVALVDEVDVVRLTQGIQGRVIHELADATHADVSHAELGGAAVEEAGLGVDTLLEDFFFQLSQGSGTAEDEVRLATEAGQLADFGPEELGQRLIGLRGDDFVRTDGRTVTPGRDEGTVDTADGTRGGVVGDEGRDARDELRVLGAVLPEHLVERASPAFGHVRELVLEEAGEGGHFAVGVLAGRGTVEGVDDGDTVVLELRQGDGDTGVDFLPRVVDPLEVGRVVVRHRVKVREALDGGGVVEDDREVDFALAAGEGLLLAGEGREQGLFLDGLGERLVLDVEVERGSRDVLEFLSGEGHDVLSGSDVSVPPPTARRRATS